MAKPSMKNLQFASVLVGLSLLGACSSSESDTPAGTGGQQTSTGGASPTGGAKTTGGTTGGTTPAPTGGASTAGGSGGSGGMTGGSTATGGATTSGGANTTGGASIGGGGSGGMPSAAGAGGTVAGAGGDSGGIGGGGGSPGGTQWVGTWAASPYLAAADAQPPSPLSNAVLRQVTRVSIGGNQIRLQLSNLSGNGPVTAKSVHVALNKSTGPADSTIDTATDKALKFGGMDSVTIEQGKEVWSDPLDFALAPLSKVTITMAMGSVPSNLTAHAGSRTTSYVQANSTDVAAAAMTSAGKTDHWYFISGIDVMAPANAKAVAIIGDSITDGRGTDTNGNNRWTDILAERLQANAATANIGVLNQGIGATNLVGTGTAAEARFQRDVLNQSGVKYAIIYNGTNDIGTGTPFQTVKTVLDKLIAAGRAKNLLVFGATIPPFGGNSYYTAANEMVRNQVNQYVKGGAFDGFIDFDAALTDGGNPPKLKSEYAAWAQMDGLHPGPAGYKKMGESVDLMLFK